MSLRRPSSASTTTDDPVVPDDVPEDVADGAVVVCVVEEAREPLGERPDQHTLVPVQGRQVDRGPLLCPSGVEGRETLDLRLPKPPGPVSSSGGRIVGSRPSVVRDTDSVCPLFRSQETPLRSYPRVNRRHSERVDPPTPSRGGGSRSLDERVWNKEEETLWTMDVLEQRLDVGSLKSSRRKSVGTLYLWDLSPSGSVRDTSDLTGE